MFCKKCGNRISEDVAFCPNCGAAASTTSKDSKATKNDKSSKKIIIAIVVTVVVLGVIIAIVLSGGKKDPVDDVNFNDITAASEIYDATLPNYSQGTAGNTVGVIDAGFEAIAYDGNIYTIGKTTLQDFINDGFTANVDVNSILETKKYLNGVTLTKNDVRLNCEFANTTSSSIPFGDAVFGSVSFSHSTYSMESLNDTENEEVSVLGGLTLCSSIDDFKTYLETQSIKSNYTNDVEDDAHIESLTFSINDVDYEFKIISTTDDGVDYEDKTIFVSNSELFIDR